MAHTGALLSQYPGSSVERTSEIDSHHRYLRFNWRLLLADGTTLIDGIDFVELNEAGKIKRIIGFFSALSTL